MLFILIIVLILCVVGLPNLGIVNYGYGPSGFLGVILFILLIWLLLGHRF